ncbi:MAG: glycosyltransferase [Ignavibacteriaceae bacterium]|nr:glycosyltransferase [Ignavibacteriaceae bacterium]
MSLAPQISVIIPTLNEEKLIVQTLSQFNKDLREKFSIEVIISDGGSTDATLDLAGKRADKIVNAVKGEKQNIPQGRNAGAKCASGKYLYFLNADTMVNNMPEFLEVTLNALGDERHSALTCRIQVFPDEMRLSDKLFHGFYNNYVRILNFLGMGMGRGECQMVKKEIFEELNGYNESLAAGEDYDLYRRIRKLGKGKIKFLNELVVYESPRRYRKFGYRRVFLDWTKNSVSVLFKNKSVSKVWEAVR